MEDQEKVLKAMQEAKKPLKAAEIAEASGLEKTVVDKVMKELKKEEVIVSPKSCYWEIKK
jgi:DNA-binding IscR family transcriptional regulator